MTSTVLRPAPRESSLPADGSVDVHAGQPTALEQPVGCFRTGKARADDGEGAVPFRWGTRGPQPCRPGPR
jgi:hypothetical protein